MSVRNIPSQTGIFVCFGFITDGCLCLFLTSVYENPYKFPYQHWKDFKFYNVDDVNMTATDLQLTKTRSTLFYKKHSLLKETMLIEMNKVLKTKC